MSFLFSDYSSVYSCFSNVVSGPIPEIFSEYIQGVKMGVWVHHNPCLYHLHVPKGKLCWGVIHGCQSPGPTLLNGGFRDAAQVLRLIETVVGKEDEHGWDETFHSLIPSSYDMQSMSKKKNWFKWPFSFKVLSHLTFVESIEIGTHPHFSLEMKLKDDAAMPSSSLSSWITAPSSSTLSCLCTKQDRWTACSLYLWMSLFWLSLVNCHQDACI